MRDNTETALCQRRMIGILVSPVRLTKDYTILLRALLALKNLPQTINLCAKLPHTDSMLAA